MLRKFLLLLILGLAIALSNRVYAAAPGEVSTDFTLIDTEGSKVQISELKDAPALLFFVDESEVSQKRLSEIGQIYDYYFASQLKIFTIVIGKDKDGASRYGQRFSFSFPLFVDPKAELAKAYGLQRFPAAVILDNQHIIRSAGDYTTDKRLHRELFRWMAEKVVVVSARKFEYEPNIIKVNQGDIVLLKLLPEDVTHGIFVDGYGLYVKEYLDRDGNIVDPQKADHHIKPGEVGLLKFVADKRGKFILRCASTCGGFHPYMLGHLIVSANWRYHLGIWLVLILAAAWLGLTLKAKGMSRDKLFGIIPLSLRFELTKFKPIRALFKNRWFPLIAIIFNLAIFTIIFAAFFVGGFYTAGNYNFGIMVVWIFWYSMLMLFMVPLVGRLWCMVCPFPLIGEWFQRGRLLGVVRQKLRGRNKRWPNKWRNLWPLVILFWVSTWFSGFFTVRPMASFIFIGTVVLTAIVMAFIFEKRTFCLFVCPVSGFQGLYANFSACEVRVKDPQICAKHTPKTCALGSEKGYGCPWMELPFEMNRNTYCGLCLECFKTCPYDNMAFNLRPPGADFLSERRRTDDIYRRRGTDESFKALTMLGIFFSFFIAFQGPYGKIKDMLRAKTAGGFFSYIAEAALVDFLIIPAVFLFFAWLSRLASRNKAVKLKQVFVNFSYSLVPLGVALWAAFSLGIILPNGSYLAAVISDPFAWGWNLFGTKAFPWTPFLTQAMPYLQMGVVLIGLLFALEYGFKFSQATYTNESEVRCGWLPIFGFLILFTIGCLGLFL